MKDKAKAGDLKAMHSTAQKLQEKKKRRWDQPSGADEPMKKKASSWDQAEVGTPSQVNAGSLQMLVYCGVEDLHGAGWLLQQGIGYWVMIND